MQRRFGIQSAYARPYSASRSGGPSEGGVHIEPPDLEGSLRAMRGRGPCIPRVALASIGSPEEARALRAEAPKRPPELRPAFLPRDRGCLRGQVARDIAARWTPSNASFGTAFDAGAVDLVVTLTEANPDFCWRSCHSDVTRERTMYIVARAGDEALVNAIGRKSTSSSDPVASLSRREHEVYDLGLRRVVERRDREALVHHRSNCQGPRSPCV